MGARSLVVGSPDEGLDTIGESDSEDHYPSSRWSCNRDDVDCLLRGSVDLQRHRPKRHREPRGAKAVFESRMHTISE